jgi:hypothetical protein
MPGRHFFAVAPLLAFGAVMATPTAPITLRYRIESKTEQVVDLSAMGQGSQTNAFTQVAIISITLNDSASGKVMHAVVDSITTDAPMPGLAEAAQKAKGAWLHGFVDGWGRTKIVATSADSNDVVVQLKNSLARFFPIVKPGSKEGDAWVDTAKVDSKTAQQTMKTSTVTSYKRGAAGPRGGESATRIEASSETKGAGTMENPMAGTMDVELNDAGTETFFVTADGRYLGGESKSEGKSLVRTPMAPDAIPVKISRTTMVSIIK